MMRNWDSPVYAFFELRPNIEYIEGHRTHIFKCSARGCKVCICRYLDSKDRSSTGNLQHHAKSCWGEETMDAACQALDIDEAHKNIVGSILRNGSITASFARKKGKVTYSHQQHTRAETRMEITGRPGYYVPLPSTVARDVKAVFARTRTRIAHMLQEYDDDISFATDTWTAPNHWAFVALMPHFIHIDAPMSILLDLVEVAKSHNGVNLVQVF
ncbi:hypothetical protein C8T65DRAFT_550164, partial [Cerioporus squamosus]